MASEEHFDSILLLSRGLPTRSEDSEATLGEQRSAQLPEAGRSTSNQNDSVMGQSLVQPGCQRV